MNWVTRVLILLSILLSTGNAQEVVKHQETLKVGAYSLKIQFSEWPLRAQRSFDLLISPEDGIQGLSGTTKLTLVGSKQVIESDLVRFPKNQNIWGYDLLAIPEKGIWNLEFKIKGSKGNGSDNLKLEVLERPVGPSVELTQPIGFIEPIWGLFMMPPIF